MIPVCPMKKWSVALMAEGTLWPQQSQHETVETTRRWEQILPFGKNLDVSFLIFETKSHFASPGWPRTCHVNQAGFKLRSFIFYED